MVIQRRPLMKPPFLAEVIAYARSHGWLVFHDYHSRRNARGLPDLLMVRVGRFVVVELKAPPDRLRVEQAIWLRLSAECSIEAHVRRPSDLPEIIAILAQPICPASFPPRSV